MSHWVFAWSWEQKVFFQNGLEGPDRMKVIFYIVPGFTWFIFYNHLYDIIRGFDMYLFH